MLFCLSMIECRPSFRKYCYDFACFIVLGRDYAFKLWIRNFWLSILSDTKVYPYL